MQFIDLKKQYSLIKEDILTQINEVLDSGQYILGAKVNELEKSLAEYVGVKHCIGVADGSKALLMALMALDIKAGDEVIVPAFTFFATASMAALLGINPVFVDVDEKTYNLNPSLIENAITPRTKAIIPVSLFGQCSQLEEINKIAAKYNLFVIEDAAQSFGAGINNKLSCSFATISCTSFFPSKPLGAYGDGGACFTNDDKLHEKLNHIRIHGQTSRYNHSIIGVNGRLDTLQAAILLSKLKLFKNEVKLREQIGNRYSQLLENYDCVTPYVMPGYSHIYAQYSILINDRDKFASKLNILNIPTSIHYPIPLHKQPSLSKYYKGSPLPVSEFLSNKIISLPMHPYLDNKTQDIIINAVRDNL